MENNSDIGKSGLKNSQLVEVFFSKQNKERKNVVVEKFIISQIKNGYELNEDFALFRERVRFFCKYVSERWANSHRKMNVFQSRNAYWLSKEFACSINLISSTSSTSVIGRPKKEYGEKTERGKRKAAEELSKSQGHETELLLRAASTSARKQHQTDIVAVLKETLASPTRPSKIKKLSQNAEKIPMRLTVDEALAFLLEKNFTKRQYLSIRHESKNRNCDIYPLYNDVAEAKIKCRPDSVHISDRLAMVSLETLLAHTAKRIVYMQREVISSLMIKTNYIKADLIVSYGFDGSTGHSSYKQSYEEPSTSADSDLSLFATTMTPLRLIDAVGRPLWNNRTPQSIRFCRPIKLEFVKETQEKILQEDWELKQQINKLTNLKIKIDGEKTIEIQFKLFLTVIDGKVLNVLTNTKSSQTCPICKATPKDFMNITDFDSEKFHVMEGNLKYGLSPLHCWIRLFEFVLHAGYKCVIRKWQVRKEEDRNSVSERKKTIQNLFWEKMSLQVDKPKTGGFGNTNDGNTARRAFADYKTFSEITGINVELIYNFKIILVAICCQFPLNTEKFQAFCYKTAQIIITEYPWLPMTATVHKVLIHSKEIMQNTLLPVGCFGEEGAESRNKLYKSDRLHHARKNSRKNNLKDVFNRALDMSDPLLSSICLKRRLEQKKRMQLPREVLDMLCAVEVSEEIVDEDEDENEDNFNELLSEAYENELNDICLDNEQ